MHVDLDAFFVSVEQVLNPELKGKPVVVGGRPGGRGVVAAASYEARAFGLHSAMPLATAVRLCPQAIFIEGSFPKYRDASQKFMAILADFSPFLEPMGLDEAYMDVTGFESIHGSIRQMATKIKQRIRDEVEICASDGEEGSFLAPLSLSKMPGIGKKTEQALNNLGIKTVGELAAVPVKTLKGHFGIYGEVLNRIANGIDDRKVEPAGAAKSISRETTFGKDTRNRSFLRATLRYLGERVGADLREKDKLARCITLKLRYADFTTITRSHTLTQTTDSDQTIYATGEKLLENALVAGKQPVRLIGIGVSQLSDSGRQLDMLDSKSQRIEHLNKSIDRIRHKYGFTAIQTGRTLQLKDLFPHSEDGYTLHTPSLSR
jgi:DNA polymerase-4